MTDVERMLEIVIRIISIEFPTCQKTFYRNIYVNFVSSKQIQHHVQAIFRHIRIKRIIRIKTKPKKYKILNQNNEEKKFK